MSVMFVLLPVALAFAAGALGVFLWATTTGQFDDLDTPPVRMLVDDDLEGSHAPASRGAPAAPGRQRLTDDRR